MLTSKLTPCLQVATLANLRSLQFSRVGYHSASMTSLRQLTSLRHAAFSHCHLPDSLSELTQLEVLEVRSPEGPADAVASSLGGALQHLTQLTGLWLDDMPAAAVGLASLAPLGRLQWLYLGLRDPADEAEAALLRGSALPLGPWQRSLRRLATSFQLAQQSLPFLAGAEQLEHLAFFQPPARPARQISRVARLLAVGGRACAPSSHYPCTCEWFPSLHRETESVLGP